MSKRYKPGDRLYYVIAHGAEDYGDGMEPAEVSLSTYIVRTIRRRPRKFMLNTKPTITPTVTAYPSEYVKDTKNGLVFDKHCPRWATRQWKETDKPLNLSRSKSGAYRAALTRLRGWQTDVDLKLEEKEFNMLVGRLKSAITRSSKK